MDAYPRRRTGSAKRGRSVGSSDRRREEALDRVCGGRGGVVPRCPPCELTRPGAESRLVEQRLERDTDARRVGVLAVEHERDASGGGAACDVELVLAVRQEQERDAGAGGARDRAVAGVRDDRGYARQQRAVRNEPHDANVPRQRWKRAGGGDRQDDVEILAVGRLADLADKLSVRRAYGRDRGQYRRPLAAQPLDPLRQRHLERRFPDPGADTNGGREEKGP